MDWLRDNAWSAWLIVAVALGLAEMLSLDLILLMLSLGALAGMIVGLAGLDLGFQVLAAGVTSIATLGLLRPKLVAKLHHGPELRLGHGKLVGRQGIVTEEITPTQIGRIKLAGEIWTAAPYDDASVIAAGSTVEVVQIKGATAYVYPLPELGSPDPLES